MDYQFKPRTSYTYNDIGIVPNKKSTIETRKSVNTIYNFLGTDINLPLLVAPMETVVGLKMVRTLEKLGGIAVLPRTSNLELDLSIRDTLIKEIGSTRTIISVPANNQIDKRINEKTEIVCIDVANGFHINVERAVKFIKENYSNIKIITGNIASIEGYKFLSDLGVDAIRVGIGNGGVCTTSLKSGIGLGQTSLIRDIANYRESVMNGEGAIIIADGGIKTSGDIVKSIALGADLVMVGGLFAGTEESPGRVLKIGDRKYKHLAGQASMYIKGQDQYVEGADVIVPYIGSLEKIWHNITDGLQSGMAYLNCNNLEQLRYLPDNNFVYLSNAAKYERSVHAVN